MATLLALEEIGSTSDCPFSYRVLLRTPEPLLPLPGKVEIVSRKNFRQVLAQVRKSDALVVGGGSLLQDVSSFRSLVYYWSILEWALFWRKPVLFYGCGLGPFRRFFSRWMVSLVLRRAFLILRDEASRTLALRLGASPSRVFLGIDPVFSLERMSKKSTSGPQKVAVFLRLVDRGQEETLFASLQALASHGVAVELVAFHRELDGELVTRLAQRLQVPGVFFTGPEEIFRYFEGVEMVLSFRLHPLVLATLLGIPWLAFDVDPKIRALASFFDGENLLSLEELSPEKLFASYQKRHLLGERVKAVKELLSVRSQVMEEHLEEFLDSLR